VGQHLAPPASHRSLTVVKTVLAGLFPTATACACSCVLITSSGCSAKLTTAPDDDPAAMRGCLRQLSLIYCRYAGYEVLFATGMHACMRKVAGAQMTLSRLCINDAPSPDITEANFLCSLAFLLSPLASRLDITKCVKHASYSDIKDGIPQHHLCLVI